MPRAGLASLFLGLCLAAAAQEAIPWQDPSPHTTKLIEVDHGISLEVLEWGRTGRSVVLLAGLGDTAHVYDDFAPRLARKYHIYAVTRRGFSPSSVPASGYDFARLAEDIVRVVGILNLARPVIAGHSFAGEEMHVLGARYPERIAGLVYIDAAFNRAGRSADFDAAARKLPPAPEPQSSDTKSISALRMFLRRNGLPVPPEAEMRARYEINAAGNVGARRAPPAEVRKTVIAALQQTAISYAPSPIRVPALALYAVPKSGNDLMRPWYPSGDPQTKENVTQLYQQARASFLRHARWFDEFSKGSRVVEISGDHHLFLTNPTDVLDQIDAFVSAAPR
jgi:pimeloyl-ACP methyl ester carboxylesterase